MAGWFDFVNGQTLPASRVQDYLMDQSVMVFASAAARTTALPTPTDGMVSYLTDVDRLFVYRSSSSAWVEVVESTNLAALSAVLPTRGNAVINGSMDIWQRGTSKSVGAFDPQYLADRWVLFTAASSQSMSQETSTVPEGSRFALRHTSATASGGGGIYQVIETANTLPFAGRTVTIQAKVTGTTGKLPFISLDFSTSVDQPATSAWTGIATSSTVSVTSGTFSTITVTMSVPSTAKSLRLGLNSGTLNNTDFLIWGQVQLEAGSVATPFIRAATTLQGELAACQRYYFRLGGDSNYQPFGFGMSTNSTSSIEFVVQHPVTMRTKPTSVESSSLAAYDQLSLFALSSITLGSTEGGRNASRISAVGTGMTAFRASTLLPNNTLNGFIALNAEL